MNSGKKFFYPAATVSLSILILAAAVFALVFCCMSNRNSNSFFAMNGIPQKKVIFGYGYVQGTVQTILQNKYAGFITKVSASSYSYVKKGDVLLEYDDYNIRKQILEKKNAIEKQKQNIAEKKITYKMKKLDPLPSEYRNIALKVNAAKSLYLRLQREMEIFSRLRKTENVSEMSMLEKEHELNSAEADYKRAMQDQKLIESGLDKLYIELAAQNVRSAEQNLQNLESELQLLEDDLKYYKIVAPHDGLCIMKSYTVGAFDEARTAVVILHRDEKKHVYVYFAEEDIWAIKENHSYTFRSNQYDGDDALYEVVCIEIPPKRFVFGGKCYYRVKFEVVKEAMPLKIDSVGRIEIETE